MLVAEPSSVQKQQKIVRFARPGGKVHFFVHTPPDNSVSIASSNDSFCSDCCGAIGSSFSCDLLSFLSGILRVLW